MAVHTKYGRWCGMCYSNLKGRSNYEGHAGYRAPKQKVFCIMGFVDDRRGSRGPGGGGDKPMSLADFGADYPRLFEMFTVTEYEDGTSRDTSSISVFYDEGRLKLCLNDKQEGFSAFVTANSVEEGLLALEVGLEEDRLLVRRVEVRPSPLSGPFVHRLCVHDARGDLRGAVPEYWFQRRGVSSRSNHC